MSRLTLLAAPLAFAAWLGLGSCSDKSADHTTDAGQSMTGTDGRPVGAANQPAPAAAPAGPAAAPAETPAATTAQNAPAVDRGQKLTGVVSDLSGAASDLGATMTDMGLVINFNADVLFDFDKADIKPEAGPTLQKLAEVVKQYTKSRVVINGYTDAKGNDAYNLTLSQRRAQAIADWLQQHGANAGGQIQVKGYGEANPVAPNARPDGSDNPAGRQQNRRVEVIIS
ncbi:OmpA family protein [Hymenobacter jeollabukensis]|uniref:OmpA family protein n=1 Tax=Hymenobacter jeollabukensis TaxID=2025313 RepID=A0A5R8WTS9_9BACT|nr:OmpA family protein [Hymenobacter jeollabukensis]TLM94238.1 OmpA family protein [Hymenobacter jeollabukensis]